MNDYDKAMRQEVSIPNWDHLPELSWKDKVAYLAFKFRQLPQTETPLEHVFGNGMYIRKMCIPAGTLLLGRAHTYGHECTLISGSLIWITPNGKRQVEGPFTVHTTPGTHIVIYAITDLVSQTVHHNKHNSQDIEALEAEHFESVDSLIAIGQTVHNRLEFV